MKWRSQVPWSIAARFNHGGNLFDKDREALVVKLRMWLRITFPAVIKMRRFAVGEQRQAGHVKSGDEYKDRLHARH